MEPDLVVSVSATNVAPLPVLTPERRALAHAIKAASPVWAESAPRVREAAFAVIAAEAGPQARQLAADLDNLLRQVIDKFAALIFLTKAGAIPSKTLDCAPWVMPSEEPARSVMQLYGLAPIIWPALGDDPSLRLWITALEALTRDAMATLPKS